MIRAALPALIALAFGASCVQPLPGAPHLVVLNTERCGSEISIQPRKSVIMLIDVRQFSAASRFEVELVDQTGNRVDLTTGLTVSASTVAYSCRGLRAGVYYMRLRENGKIRGEYQIHAQPGSSGVC